MEAKIGEPCGTRTHDTLIKRFVLKSLSIRQNLLVFFIKSILSSVKSRGGQKDEDRGGYPVVSN